jgi:hypothetical protein
LRWRLGVEPEQTFLRGTAFQASSPSFAVGVTRTQPDQLADINPLSLNHFVHTGRATLDLLSQIMCHGAPPEKGPLSGLNKRLILFPAGDYTLRSIKLATASHGHVGL